MISFFANIFGYLLNFLYNLIQNYGLAIILFSVIIKILMIPLSIKQQKSLKKNAKLQTEMKSIQAKYKNNPEKLNQETIALYKREKMSPFSGCLSAIIQIVLLFSIFYLVKSPLTYMKKIDEGTINQYVNQLQQSGQMNNNGYPEIEVIEKLGDTNENININMDFFGINLSKVPTQSLTDPKVYIIPVLYVISSFISIRITTKMQKQMMPDKKDEENENKEPDPMEQANKSMSLLMPIMSISIAIIAPLGLALYWLTNNILMIAERLILNHFLKEEE